MSSLRWAAIIALAMMLANATRTMAAEEVGQAVLIKTAVTGATGPLAVKAPVHRDERIRTSNTGLGQFVFLDGTKLAVGWGSSVVIDKYVFDSSNSVKKLTIRAAKGTFRWISGNSASSAYRIVTPAGTIGVRGTAFDVHIAPSGKTAIVLLKGAATFCGGGGCRELKRRCDCVIATPGGGLSPASKVDRSIFASLGTSRALPFLSGNQTLSRGFGMGANCGLAAAAAVEKEGRPRSQQQPSPHSAPSPSPNAPSHSPDPPSHSPPSHSPDPPSHNPPSSPSRPDPPGRPPSNPPDPPSPPAPTPNATDDGNNGHGNDPGRHDDSNPGKSGGPGHVNDNGHGGGNGHGNGNSHGNGNGKR
jgi:hypothetical protein